MNADTELIESWSRDTHSAIVGYATDGFPFYGVYALSGPDNAACPIVAMRANYTIKTGTRSGGSGGKYDGSFVKDFAQRRGPGGDDFGPGQEPFRRGPPPPRRGPPRWNLGTIAFKLLCTNTDANPVKNIFQIDTAVLKLSRKSRSKLDLKR